MATSDTGAVVREGRDRAATVLMLLAALGALVAFAGSIGPAVSAGPGAVVEGWRAYGYLVFAGLFVLLALRPRHYPGVWELVIFHKAAVSVTALLARGGAADALEVAVADGTLAAMILAAYLLSRGYAGWSRLRGGR